MLTRRQLEALLSGTPDRHNLKISLENAVPEFKQKMMALTDDADIKQLGAQMLAHVRTLVAASVADANYGRACELLRTVRDEFVDSEVPELYNDLLKELKKDIVAKTLDGDRDDMWRAAESFHLGLVTDEEVGGEGVGLTAEAAAAFWRLDGAPQP